MTKRMLIDAAHAEQVRMAIIDDDRLEDFEVETAGKEQIKGNIYVGEVTRVEPSLQAAFISYGGNRNGFLAFSEIHPAFFDVPASEKQELLAELQEIADRRKNRDKQREEDLEKLAAEKAAAEEVVAGDDTEENRDDDGDLTDAERAEDARALALANQTGADDAEPDVIQSKRPKRHNAEENVTDTADSDEGDGEERRQPIHRRYHIADVVKEGQKILIQINKEERGNKGAALSTYISMPGRFCVLMPNTPYAGGISRKINDMSARRTLKTIIADAKVPENMGLIVRTAGVGQEAEDIHRDINNLVSLWGTIDKSYAKATAAPALLHEDGSLAVRTVRDMFSAGIEEVTISGRKTYRTVKDYVKALMPDQAKVIKEHRAATPIFSHYDIEDKISRLHSTRVNLPSGGYLIINPTEALVSVDVNSGRATQEKNIEETAYKTNLEAADEVARQLRLRDLAGLVVVDFIDMEETRHERAVEKAMRKAVKTDRARVQIAPISQFGLLEMSRQRLRPSLGESTMVACPHCHGTGLVQSLETAALTVLRSLEKEDVRKKADKVTITTSSELAVFILNNKRELIRDIETRYKLKIYIRGDERYVAPDHRLDMIHVDGRGIEKSQTFEVSLRDNPEEEDKPKRRRGNRSNRKRQKDDESPARDDSSKTDAASTAPEGDDHHTDDGDADDNAKTKRPRRDRKRSNTRGRRGRRGEKPEHNGDPQPESKPEHAAESANKADSTPKRKRRTAKKKVASSKANKGITVETVADSGEKSVEKAGKSGVKKVFQRWWSKSE